MSDLSPSGLHHVGVVVRDFEAAYRLYHDRLGLEEVDRVEREDLRAVFLECGNTRIELIEILDDAARELRLGDRDAVIEHLAFSVVDLGPTLHALDVLEIRLAAPPRTTLGARTAFTDASTSGGVMLQFLEQRPEEPEETV